MQTWIVWDMMTAQVKLVVHHVPTDVGREKTVIVEIARAGLWPQEVGKTSEYIYVEIAEYAPTLILKQSYEQGIRNVEWEDMLWQPTERQEKTVKVKTETDTWGRLRQSKKQE